MDQSQKQLSKKEQQKADIKKELSQKYRQSKFIYQSAYSERQWLKSHGKAKYIKFDDGDIQKLRQYFSELDEDGSKSIGVDELEDPLIALGLASTREEVEALIQSVDDDGSQQIEFKEFLSIMSSIDSGGDSNSSAIFEFFKKMINEEYSDQKDSTVPFKLYVSQFRRKKILDAITEFNQQRKDQGMKILQAFKKQQTFKKVQEKLKNGENPNDISLDQIPNDEYCNTRNGFHIDRVDRKPINDNNFLIKPKKANNVLIKPKSNQILSNSNYNNK